ncbi:hypothetical protein [Undibacterium parvum]|uniref:hypothetical protein n=1 Tax=Undibacterium parvum TaxID=401471 RepID=UPI001D1323D1|nr:hypothetical protein [Undibacterium parvum]
MKNAIRFKSSAQRGELPASLRKLSLALMLALPGVLLAVPASAQQGAIVQRPAGTSTISNPTASRSGMDSRVAAAIHGISGNLGGRRHRYFWSAWPASTTGVLRCWQQLACQLRCWSYCCVSRRPRYRSADSSGHISGDISRDTKK